MDNQEKGTLIVTKTTKGYSATLAFERDGKTKSLPVTGWRPTDDKHNQKACLFQRKDGMLVFLAIEEGGEVLYSMEPRQASPSSNQGGGQNAGQAQEPGNLFDLAKTTMPRDVRAITSLKNIDNFSLKLNKGAYWVRETKDKYGNTLNLTPDKQKFITWQSARGQGITKMMKPGNFGGFPFDHWAKRLKSSAFSVLDDKNRFEFQSRLDWRMIVGLGNESIYETSITLHHVYGVPFIPASAIKGVFRSYIIGKYFSNRETLAIQDKGFCDIFGCPEELTLPNSKEKVKSFYGKARSGNVIFFDAVPCNVPTLSPDIMNPHYGEYYSSKSEQVKAPTDTQNPVPIPFFTVSNTSFQFIAGLLPGTDLLIEGKLNASTKGIEFIREQLKLALSEQGIGAKTAIGYGYMS